MLKRREGCDTYLTHVCRHHWSRGSPVKRLNIRSFQPTLWLSSVEVTPTLDHVCHQIEKAYQLVLQSRQSPSITQPSASTTLTSLSPLAVLAKTLVSLLLQLLAESSLYLIFSLGSLPYSDVFKRKSGRCSTLPFFLRFFIVSSFQVFVLY